VAQGDFLELAFADGQRVLPVLRRFPTVWERGSEGESAFVRRSDEIGFRIEVKSHEGNSFHIGPGGFFLVEADGTKHERAGSASLEFADLKSGQRVEGYVVFPKMKSLAGRP